MSEWVKAGEYGKLPPVVDNLNYLKEITDYLLTVSGDTIGTSGTSGIDGTSGTSGTDGTSGSSGSSGSSGTDGTSGSSGIDGISGSSGTSGSVDNFGGNSMLYKFNNNISLSSPNSGYLKINNNVPSLATKLIVDYRNFNGSFVDSWLRSISSNSNSYFRLFKENDSSIFCIYKILGMSDLGIISKYVSFDVEIIYADDNSFFVLDDSVILSYTESGAGLETGVNIPTLKLDTGFYNSINNEDVPTDTLRCYWESANNIFLNYNPEIWVFRRKNYVRKTTNDGKIRHKKWTHEPHLNGIKFQNSSYYSGSIVCPVKEIENIGRHTEFIMTITGSSEKMIVPLDPYDYVYGLTNTGWTKLSDTTNYDDIIKVSITGRRRSKSLPLRFAIVIDNPDTNSNNPKIIGDLSDTIYMRYGRTSGKGNVICYNWNEIDIDMFGSNRFT